MSNKGMSLPSNEIFSLPAQVHIVGELEKRLPLHDFLIRFMRVFRAERRIPDEALEHDSPQ